MKIAAYQFAVSGDIRNNFEEIKKAISMAKENLVELVIFPKQFAYMALIYFYIH